MNNCSDCAFPQKCLPPGLNKQQLFELDTLVRTPYLLKRRELLHRRNENFRNLYAVRSGALKAYVLDKSGHERIVNFYLPGEIAGLEGIHEKRYPYALAALSSTKLCEIPYDSLLALAKEHRSLPNHLLNLASYRMALNSYTIFTDAEERVEAFLSELRTRMARFENRASQLILPMTRQDIGNYLGLAPETISRILRNLQQRKLVTIKNRHFCFTN